MSALDMFVKLMREAQFADMRAFRESLRLVSNDEYRELYRANLRMSEIYFSRPAHAQLPQGDRVH